VGLLLASVGSAVPIAWRSEPALSPEEETLVGTWGYRITDPAIQFGTQAGWIRNQWHIHEFTTDHVYRESIVSGDNPSHRFVRLEGRWRVVSGHLLMRPASDARFRQAVGEVSNRIWRATGLNLISVPQQVFSADLLFQFPEDDLLELRNPGERPFTAMTIEGVPYSLHRLRPVGDPRRTTQPQESRGSR
jgi:hypothetical protein